MVEAQSAADAAMKVFEDNALALFMFWVTAAVVSRRLVKAVLSALTVEEVGYATNLPARSSGR